MPPMPIATAGRPRRNASISTRPRPSERDGSTRHVASSRAAATSACVRRSVHARLRRQVADERLDHGPLRAAADDAQPRVRHARRGEPPRAGEAVDVLVELEHADEQRRRLLGQRLRRALEEELEVHERGELARRLDAELAHEARRVGRDRAHRVGAAQAERADGVGERRERAPERRAVEPRGRAPVAVQLDDHLRARAARATRTPPRTGSASRSRPAGARARARRTRSGSSA